MSSRSLIVVKYLAFAYIGISLSSTIQEGEASVRLLASSVLRNYQMGSNAHLHGAEDAFR